MQNLKLESGGEGGEAGDAPQAVTQTVSPQDKVEALRRVQVFAELPEEQLRWFVENAVERWAEPGEIIFRKGDPADQMTVYLEGEAHTRQDETNLDGNVYIAQAGDPQTEVSGKLPYSRMKAFPATSRAVTRARLLLFHERLFPEMLRRMPVLAERLVGLMSDRVRESTKMDQQRDKLMALGKLSAGLAHELNNPAAAAKRGANEMLGALEELRAADLRLCRHNLTPEQRQFIAEFESEAIAHTSTTMPLGALEQSDREDELGAWLDEQGVAESWKLAPTFSEAGVDTKALERVLDETGRDALGDVLARIAAQLSTAKLIGDIKTSVGRISELVGAIKEYSYMDQASVQEVDLHKGLDNTVLILRYKLRKKNIDVVRDYADDLPRVTAYGSELNQVWTNLIDNAVDAMGDGGRLKIRTKLEPTDVLVEIRDNGPGIPVEVQTHIFEPFYTTKPVGEGTGLGLDAVSRIVRKHRGNIRVQSKPGDTCFQVRLPLAQ
ncbi:MAG TPA: ATP-binding protein [Pyrinomonadaceae bacterium]|nr:ATP-binding protein [Pyrinomonadaceae bacterium]